MYMEDLEFKDIMNKVKARIDIKFMLQGGLLYKDAWLCILKKANRMNWM